MCRRRERHALCMVPRRASDDAPCLFFVGQLGYFETGAPHLERTRYLQVFGLQVYLAKRVDVWGKDEVGAADDSPQRIRRLINSV